MDPRLQEKINTIFKDELSLITKQIRPINEGSYNKVFRVSCSQNEYIFKIYRDGIIPTPNTIKLWQITSQQRSLNIPHNILLDRSDNYFEFGFIITEYIRGSTMNTILNEGEEDMPRYFKQIGEICKSIHRIAIDNYCFKQPTSLKEKITNLLDEYEGTQLLPQTLLDKIKHITNRISKNYNGKATIVHGDLSPANILIKDNSFFIVDWDLSKIDCNYIDMFWPLYWAKREFNVSNSKLDKITESLLTGYNIKVSSIEDTLKNREFYFLKFCLDQILYYRYVTLEHRKVENITRILMELIDLLDP